MRCRFMPLPVPTFGLLPSTREIAEKVLRRGRGGTPPEASGLGGDTCTPRGTVPVAAAGRLQLSCD